MSTLSTQTKRTLNWSNNETGVLKLVALEDIEYIFLKFKLKCFEVTCIPNTENCKFLEIGNMTSAKTLSSSENQK